MYGSSSKFHCAESSHIERVFCKFKVKIWKYNLLFYELSCKRYICLIILSFPGVVLLQFITLFL